MAKRHLYFCCRLRITWRILCSRQSMKCSCCVVVVGKTAAPAPGCGRNARAIITVRVREECLNAFVYHYLNSYYRNLSVRKFPLVKRSLIERLCLSLCRRVQPVHILARQYTPSWAAPTTSVALFLRQIVCANGKWTSARGIFTTISLKSELKTS